MTKLQSPPRGSYDYLLRPRLEPEARKPHETREPPREPRVVVNIELIHPYPPSRRRRRRGSYRAALAVFAIVAAFLLLGALR
jgi:hypothetical protein